MEFTYNCKREAVSAAQRSVAVGSRGMVSSSQHLATTAGLRMLLRGGNAIDAAIAMVATLSVVEPQSVGIGGDAFALIHLDKEEKLIGMNGSGRAPYEASIDWFLQRGMKEIPERGILPVTVPGALHAWAQVLEWYGTCSLAKVLNDAIFYAREGYPVTEVIAGEWSQAATCLRANEAAARTYLVGGAAPRPGYRFRNPDLARTLEMVAHDGTGVFYEGEICDAIVRCSTELGGLLTKKDFADHTTTWVEPISTGYRGYTVYEIPPNGQGMVALQMLNVLQDYDLASFGHNSADHIHVLMEAKKAAFSDRDTFITDPEFETIPLEQLLSREYAKTIRDRISMSKAQPPPPALSYSRPSDTVYVTAVDEERNAVSFISSIFQHFGSGVVVDGTGIVLQNRGRSFSLDPGHFNRLEPHKRPMHTIIPAMLFKDQKFVMSFGVVGADMQPQGQVQFLANLIDFKMNLQEAMDAPRARHIDGMKIYLEEGITDETIATLKSRGHQVVGRAFATNQVGGGQAIYLDREQDVLLAASDRRKDGCAIGY